MSARRRGAPRTSSGTTRTCSRSIRCDAENRGISDGDLVALASRAGETTLRAAISERMQPGVVYTTFHLPDTGANVVTTEFSDWATNCPEYKVTAVQVRLTNRPSEWQERFREDDTRLTRGSPPRRRSSARPYRPRA